MNQANKIVIEGKVIEREIDFGNSIKYYATVEKDNEEISDLLYDFEGEEVKITIQRKQENAELNEQQETAFIILFEMAKSQGRNENEAIKFVQATYELIASGMEDASQFPSPERIEEGIKNQLKRSTVWRNNQEKENV